MEKRKLTGYPSIDKPQMRFYREEPVREINTEQTIYNLIFSPNEGNMDSSAIEYLGVEWPFYKLKNETDRAASAFYHSGLRKGDTVLIGVSNGPEVVVTLLALNKIGVVSKWFDVRASVKDIEEYAVESKCRYIIAFDLLLPKIKAVLDKTKLEKVIIITPADSLSKIKQIGYTAKERLSIPNDSRYYRFYSFIKSYEADPIECVAFDKNRPSVMIQSSGTTGKP